MRLFTSFRNSPKSGLLVLAALTLFAPFHVQAQMLTGFGGSVTAPREAMPSLQPSPKPQALTSPVPAPKAKGIAIPFDQGLKSPAAPDKNSDAPVDLQADAMEHNDQTGIVTATGNVFIEQAGRILRADQVTYDLNNDKAYAKGHVVLNEITGDVHYADEVELTGEFKDGFVTGLKSKLADGSRFTAVSGTRQGGVKTTMKDASYTPCEPCKAHPEKAPTWQIKAGEVKHDQNEHKVEYKDATFEAWGVPIAYMPYFSHPDGSIKQKSGFLSPTAGYTSQLGAFVSNQYYWGIAPDQDATFGVTAMTAEAPLLTGEYRKRWANAQTQTQASMTYSGRDDRVSGVEVAQDDELRGHVLSKNRWDIDNKWRAGLNVHWASDDQFLRQYDMDNEDVLENELYAERFSGRDYTVGRFLTFQDIRIREEREDQPQILPEVITSFIGEPGSVPVVGGRWSLGGSMLAMRRDGSGADMNRISLDAGYQKRMVSDYGFLTNVTADMRSDSYYARDRLFASNNPGIEDDSTETRLFPQAHVQTSYPMAKQYETMQARIEPIVALTVAPNIDVNEKIPNEDSRDVQIDASNLFEPNRFPGLDRVEDQSRVTAGVRTGLYDYNGNYGDVFLGQSYRLDEDDNPFPAGSGLDDKSSDIVGQVSGHTENYDVNYRFQLDSGNLASQRHEIDAMATFDRWYLGGQYLFAKGLENTDIDESREQLQGNVGYFVTPEWQVRGGAVQDLGESPGLRQAYVGLDYFGQCLFWSLTGQKNLTTDSSGESDMEILFRIGLKNLGEFERSRVTVKQEAEAAAQNPLNTNGITGQTNLMGASNEVYQPKTFEDANIIARSKAEAAARENTFTSVTSSQQFMTAPMQAEPLATTMDNRAPPPPQMMTMPALTPAPQQLTAPPAPVPVAQATPAPARGSAFLTAF